MNETQRKAIREAVAILRIHRAVLISYRKDRTRISKTALKAAEDGIEQAIDKLNDLVEDVEIRFHNYYECPACKITWEDEWDSTCDDECPNCGVAISPYKSEDIR